MPPVTEYDESDNHYPATSGAPARTAPPRKPPFLVDFATSGFMNGAPVNISVKVDINLLPRLIARLMELGLEPIERPLRFDMTAEGNPICPRHRVPMRKRGKQGDAWFSHQVVDEQGESKWCRGYHGPSSEGYYCNTLYSGKDD